MGAASPPSRLLLVINVCTDITPYFKGLLTQQQVDLFSTHNLLIRTITCSSPACEKAALKSPFYPLQSLAFQQALEISILYVSSSPMAVFCSLYLKTISVHLCNYLYLLSLHYNVMSIFNFFLMDLLDFCSVMIKVT